MDAKLVGRINALETLVLTFTGIMIKHTYGDDPDGSKVKALFEVVRATAMNRASKGSQAEIFQTEKAIDELLRLMEANLLLLYSPRTPNA